ncbi:MAG: dienelactone hydrolase family protein [Chloroflexota bacterium]
MEGNRSIEQRGVVAELVRYSAHGVAGLTELEGFLARPNDGTPHPGVIVIQEWWGLEPHIKSVAERLADAGYVALAPDLYHGKIATEPNEAQKAMMAFNLDQAVDEIQQAIDYLQGRDDVQPKKVGVVGFCMGGRLTWRVAERENGELAAIAPFYAGGFQPTTADIQKVTAPALVVWGRSDQSIPAAQREHIEKLLRDEGKTYKALVYPAGHAFLNDTHPTYSAAAANEAWSELLAWFSRYLG